MAVSFASRPLRSTILLTGNNHVTPPPPPAQSCTEHGHNHLGRQAGACGEQQRKLQAGRLIPRSPSGAQHLLAGPPGAFPCRGPPIRVAIAEAEFPRTNEEALTSPSPRRRRRRFLADGALVAGATEESAARPDPEASSPRARPGCPSGSSQAGGWQMDIKGQYWTDDDSDGENESEEFLYGVQGTCAADLYRHPQLDVDIEAVKELYSENSVSVREYGTIDDVDIDLHINIGFLDEEVATAWKVLRTEPIILRLRFSLSQYLDGPEPSIEVFQPSNKEGFGLGLQLKKILGMFTSQQWKHLSNDFLKTQQEKRHSWFKAGGTIKKFRAGLSIFSPIPKSPSFPVIQDSMLKGKLGVPELRVNRLMNRSISCTMKNSKVEVFGYPPSTQAGVVPFNILVGGHCKNIPTLEYGFLVQIMKYAEQRIPTLNEYCVVCDEQHVFQNGSMLKPAVCTRELCVFSFYTLGVMSGAAEEVATGAEHLWQFGFEYGLPKYARAVWEQEEERKGW
ncbi:polyADP-ribose polymerase PARP6 [Crotalus adamanteus]|uniref:PolyADP-ribose polymerase PARP6 n=1 Tax=Crotalus adamanteus TaxID=8729 RepID=A0AAW1AWT5_CROAD